MPALAALLLCAAALAVVVTAAPSDRQQARFTALMQQARKFKCREPRPRAVLSTELVYVGPSERVDPPYAVLHRCDGGAGCCESHDRVCDVRDAQEVTLVFLVSDTVRGGSEYREATHTNHTRCHCVSKEPQPPK
ncbi:uncharacterized protein LOC126251593 [Schistocerca nitens]|uniref:uncharacterized protein LOC126251593 n=1 Tax=Schistocerca nitens TaxID=7011 RepID=UPI002119A82B|nr:uncharacterized protein LOC126251593 [Schistocerca nitens]